MANYDSNYAIAQEISARIGNSPIPFDSVYSICLEIYRQLGGEEENFDSVYSILLEILPLVEGGGTNVIDDTSIRLDKTWSSSKINSEIEAHSGATYTAGQNISIDASNAISADGYVFDSSNYSFATKYRDDEDPTIIGTNIATGNESHAEGWATQAIGDYGSHAEGTETQANGAASHAEGNQTVATGNYSHAEGGATQATGSAAHAEGQNTVASGKKSHAEGGKLNSQNPTTAAGNGSHAEGQSTLASGQSSHAEGELTEAKNGAEHAQGNCNVSHKNSDTYGDAGNTMDSIGIGYVLNNVPQRKNALEIMQNGDMYLYGAGGYQGTDTKVQNASIMTVQEVINSKADVYEIATLADIEALFVMPTFYIDSSLYKTYGNLNWAQWLSSKYNTANYTHIYNASSYDSTIEPLPEVDSSAYPVQNGQYYSTCEDTYVPATGPADDEIWYTTESGNLWEPFIDNGDGAESTLLRVNNSNVTILSNNYVNGHGVIKYSEPITSLDYLFGKQDDGGSLMSTDITTLTLPNSITFVDDILNGSAPELEAIYYNGTVAECEEIDWEAFDYNINLQGESVIICLDGTYSLSDEGGGGEYGGGEQY